MAMLMQGMQEPISPYIGERFNNAFLRPTLLCWAIFSLNRVHRKSCITIQEGRALNLPGSVMVAHQNLGLTVEVRVLTGQF